MRPDPLPHPDHGLSDDDKAVLETIRGLCESIKDSAFSCGEFPVEKSLSEEYDKLCGTTQAHTDALLGAVRGILRQKTTNHATAEEIILARESQIGQMFDRIEQLRTALKDAISTYDPDREVTLVSAERQEAWIQALHY